MKVVFMGTPAFAVPSLRQLTASGHEVLAVVTNPDRPSGRGRRTSAPPVKGTALELGLKVLQPTSLGDTGVADELATLDADLFVVVAFSILPRRLLAVPRLGSVNLHPSLLPAYRGAAPIVWALFSGESETGVTTFLLSPRVDAGDILLQERVAIEPDETAGELEARLREIGAALVVASLDGLEKGVLTPIPQGTAGASRAPKLGREDGRLDWRLSTEDLRNRVRGANPVPGAFTEWAGGVLKVHRACRADGDFRGEPGTVLSAGPKEGGVVVATGDGALRLVEVQPAGSPRMEGAAFVRGHRIEAGMVLGAEALASGG